MGNRPSAVDVVVLTTSLNGVIAHEAADLTVSVQAGMTLANLQERLGEQGQYLPLQAPLPHRSTIGGILATAVSGPWRLAYGGPRDWLIGSSVVLADGTQAKSGGQVVKNVTGYDLNRLYTGSLGTSGGDSERHLQGVTEASGGGVGGSAFRFGGGCLGCLAETAGAFVFAEGSADFVRRERPVVAGVG